ncbi:hypothetical protein [Pseudolysinimonas sp.]|uniref:hypothetical protein n=1 Tax=Pseudolysinimonas sp. TaxID=2680009 RepID=UPI003F7EDA74
MTAPAPLEVGEYVTVGSPRRGALTWQIKAIVLDLSIIDGQEVAATALLISGTTSRRRWEPLENLTRFTPTTQEDQ